MGLEAFRGVTERCFWGGINLVQEWSKGYINGSTNGYTDDMGHDMLKTANK